MKILIVGLGVIGGSYAEKLSEKHEIFAIDSDIETLNDAVDNGVVKPFIKCSQFKEMDLIILCLYPRDNLKFVKDNSSFLGMNNLLTDVAGTKTKEYYQIKEIVKKKCRYISHHPMAGSEKTGFKNRDKNMFKNANFLIISDFDNKKEDYGKIETMANDLNFKKTLYVTPEEHDELIAFTSQLPHLLAIALMNTDNNEKTIDATGDSFRDLTRIANINVDLWSELFLSNREYLKKTLKECINELSRINDIIEKNDVNELRDVLLKAKKRREDFD